jgi:hypothetical protein
VNGPLSVATIVAALVLAAWYLIQAARNKPPTRFDLLAMAVLGVLVAVLCVVAVVGMFEPHHPSDEATFGGYLARMEPTRWGSLILGVACLTLPVLVLRLQQIASVVTGG